MLLDINPMMLGLLTNGTGIPCLGVGLIEQPDGSFALGLGQTEEQKAALTAVVNEMRQASGMLPAEPPKPDIQIVQSGEAICGVCRKPLVQHREMCVPK